MSGNHARELEQPRRDSYDVEIAERKDAPGAWTVEAIDVDGGIEQAIFAGPRARERAEVYLSFQYDSNWRSLRQIDLSWRLDERAELLHLDGGIEQAIFAGPRARERAEVYLSFQAEPCSPSPTRRVRRNAARPQDRP